jgi:outer membrane biosynthesis protein TonB
MAITQIPFQDPAPPAEKPLPEQLDLYTVRDWETAYRNLDAAVPHLLIQLQDDLARSRKREAVWISIIGHLLVIMLLWNYKLIEKYMPFHMAVVVPVRPTQDNDITFLALPPDAQKLSRKPNTNALSDKDRIATTRRPELDLKELQKILGTPPPGAPGLPGPNGPPAGPPAMAQNQPPAGQSASPRPQSESNQTAQLQLPPRPNNVFSKYGGSMTAGSAIQQAAQAAAARRASGGGQGGYDGLGTAAHGRPYGNFEILSDTRGVDFFPYLQRIKIEIERHWYEVLPESALPPILKKGKLMIQFSIMKDGSIRGMLLVASSGDEALDRAAWGGIVGSNPLPPLPEEYIRQGGTDLTLRGIFLYNLDERDFQ